jgi:predicted nucleic acid-binding protein
LVFHDVDPGILLDIGARYGLTAYDAAYLVLADQLAAPLLTFDQRLAEAAARLFGAAS